MSDLDKKLEELVRLCKGSVTVEFNDHTTNYQTVADCLAANFGGRYDDIDDRVKAEMIKHSRIVEVQFYPHTPIGFYVIVHYDLNEALDEALEIAREEAKR